MNVIATTYSDKAVEECKAIISFQFEGFDIFDIRFVNGYSRIGGKLANIDNTALNTGYWSLGWAGDFYIASIRSQSILVLEKEREAILYKQYISIHPSLTLVNDGKSCLNEECIPK